MRVGDHDMSNLTMPVELNRPLPRDVRLTAEGIWRVSTATVLLLIALSWVSLIVVSFLLQKEHYAELEREGRKTIATVERIHGSGIYYSFSYDGKAFSGNSAIPSRLQSQLKESDPLTVLYLPSNPRVNHPAGWEETASQGLGVLLYPMFIGAGGAWVVLDLRKTRRLARDGMVAHGIVKKWTLYNRTGGITVDFEFSLPNGDKRDGLGWSQEPLEKGTGIWVLYLPSAPNVSTSYPLHHWRVA